MKSNYYSNSVLFTPEYDIRLKGEYLRLWSNCDWQHFLSAPFYSHTEQFLTPLYIWASGTSRCTAEYQRKRRKNSKSWGFGIELVTAGNAVISCEGRTFYVAAGEVILLHEGMELEWGAGNAGYLHKRTLQIDGTSLDSVLRNTRLIDAVHIKPVSPATLANLFKNINRIFAEKPQDQLEKLALAAFAVLLELAKTTKPEPYPPAVTQAIQCMKDNVYRTLKSEEIAHASCVSASHLNLLFRKHLKTSPITFFLQMKFDLAKVLLTEQSGSVKQTADILGYKDPYYFSRLFKSITKLSPQEFKANFGKHKL